MLYIYAHGHILREGWMARIVYHPAGLGGGGGGMNQACSACICTGLHVSCRRFHHAPATRPIQYTVYEYSQYSILSILLSSHWKHFHDWAHWHLWDFYLLIFYHIFLVNDYLFFRSLLMKECLKNDVGRYISILFPFSCVTRLYLVTTVDNDTSEFNTRRCQWCRRVLEVRLRTAHCDTTLPVIV